MNNFIIAQIFGVIGIIFSVLSMQMKTRKNIMIILIALNAASTLNFLFLNSITGCLICFFGAIETLINYLFDSKNKKIPFYIIGLYIIINIVLGMISYTNYIDIIPIICALLFCATVCVAKESSIRKIMFGNQILWLAYDIVVKAYMFSVSNVLTLISIVISMIRYDIKKSKLNVYFFQL